MSCLLEVCVDSYASAMSAVKGGADRLELCSSLPLGGLTPSPALLKQIKAETDIPVNCLIRSRAGDFLYSEKEIALMCMEIEMLRDYGADGFVIGAITAEGHLDENALKRMIFLNCILLDNKSKKVYNCRKSIKYLSELEAE